jgi:hypothetical protein
MHPRRLGYNTICLTCEEPIAHDERAYHEHGIGAWHEDCDPPFNLPLYRRERDRGQRSRRPRLQLSIDDTQR